MLSDFPFLCCPLCKGSLSIEEDSYNCMSCLRAYPVVLGIPDFRVFPDPYIDYEGDYKKAAYIVEQTEDLDFEATLRFYWKITPNVDQERAERFVRHALNLVDRSVINLNEIEALCAERGSPRSGAILEIGCGTGGFLIAAKSKFEQVVGIDIAFRWLVIARKRLNQAGLHIPLVCSCSESLPFKEGSFDLVVAEDVLEHVRNQQATVNECYRVSTDKAYLFMTTLNRFSITPEPHVRVWGVGFLPRKWMSSYVKLVKGIPYQYIKVLSFPELSNLLHGSAFQAHWITLPTVPPEEAEKFSASEKLQIAIYNLVRKVPLLRAILYIFGPFFHVLSYANKGADPKA